MGMSRSFYPIAIGSDALASRSPKASAGKAQPAPGDAGSFGVCVVSVAVHCADLADPGLRSGLAFEPGKSHLAVGCAGLDGDCCVGSCQAGGAVAQAPESASKPHSQYSQLDIEGISADDSATDLACLADKSAGCGSTSDSAI